MLIDPATHSKADNYKLLTNLVVPRPIAWITSLDADGLVNLAPFSFFNAVCADPICVMVSIGQRDDGTPKDTARNILARGEFVVHLVTEDLFDAMNLSAADFPPDIGELAAAGLHAAPSSRIAVPRVAEAQVGMECRLHSHQPLTGRKHADHRRGGDVPCRRRAAWRTPAHRRLRTDRQDGVAIGLLPQQRPLQRHPHRLSRLGGDAARRRPMRRSRRADAPAAARHAAQCCGLRNFST